MASGNKQNKYKTSENFVWSKFTGKIFLNSEKNDNLWALVKTQNMDGAKQMVIKFLRQAGHSYDKIAQQVGYTKSTTKRICSLCKRAVYWRKGREQAGQKKTFL